MLSVAVLLFVFEWEHQGRSSPLETREYRAVTHTQPLLHPTWTRSYQLYGQPHALWLTSDRAAENLAQLRYILDMAAQAGAVPEIVIYAIPERDLNRASAGGFRSWPAYLAGSRELAAAIQAFVAQTGLRPRIYLEPDSIAHAVQYLREHPSGTAARKLYRERLQHLKLLVGMHGEAGALVYLDAAHSGWFGSDDEGIEAMAQALNEAGVAQAAGITSNVSNRQKVRKGKTGELEYLRRLVHGLDLDNPDVIVDTSRNGGTYRPRRYFLAPDGALYDNEHSGGRLIGKWRRQPSGGIRLRAGSHTVFLSQLQDQQYRFEEDAMQLTAPIWLDPVGAVKPGPAPSDQTGLPVIRRFRHIKPPDEADGALGYMPGSSRHQTNRNFLALNNQH